MLDFRAVVSKLLYTFYSPENGLNHDLRVVFYVGYRNFDYLCGANAILNYEYDNT